jgi:uncharacterized coiled-coil protein SlyX
MIDPALPGFEELMTILGTVSSKLPGREGNAIRGHVQRLAEILATQGPDSELRARAATELEQLVGAVARLGGAQRGPSAQAIRAMDLGKLADGLRTFAAYLRTPTAESQAQVEQLVATLPGAAVPRPVPLDELRIDGTIEELAVESARRHGLVGVELRRAVERMKRQMSALMQKLEIRARQEASRAQTAAEFERLVDAVVQTGSTLGQAIANERGPIVQAFRSVDLARMAEGLRVFAGWLSTPASDSAAHVAELRARLAETLGPPTTGDPARSEAERRADFEREIKLEVDQIFRSTRPVER